MAWSKPPGALDHWEGTSPLARQFEKQRCPVSRASWKQAVPRGRPGSLIPVGYASQPHTRLALSYMPLFLRPKGEGPGPQSGSDLGVSHLGTRRLLGTASALIPTGTARCLLGDQGLGLGEASSPCSHTARGRRVRPGGLRRTFGTEMRHLRLVRQWELSGCSQLGQLSSWGSFLVGRGGQKRERLVQVVGPPSAWGFGQDLGQARADSAQTSAAPLRNQEPPVLQTAPKGLWLLLKKRSFRVTSLQTKPDGGGRNLWSVRLETHCGTAAGAHPPQTGRWPSCWASTWEEGSLFR